MYREWGPRSQPIWNPLKNAGKEDSITRELKGLDEFCNVCRQKGHPWRRCPKLNKNGSSDGSALASHAKLLQKIDKSYCVNCFSRGHEQEDCPTVDGRKDENTLQTQEEEDTERFLQAKRLTLKRASERFRETEQTGNVESKKRFKFQKIKRKANHSDVQPKKKAKVENKKEIKKETKEKKSLHAEETLAKLRNSLLEAKSAKRKKSLHTKEIVMKQKTSLHTEASKKTDEEEKQTINPLAGLSYSSSDSETSSS